MPKIKRLNMTEVSGVDYPAHLANGWSVAKSQTTQSRPPSSGRSGRMTQ